MRTEGHSGNKEPYDGRDPEFLKNKENASGNAKDDDQCF